MVSLRGLRIIAGVVLVVACGGQSESDDTGAGRGSGGSGGSNDTGGAGGTQPTGGDAGTPAVGGTGQGGSGTGLGGTAGDIGGGGLGGGFACCTAAAICPAGSTQVSAGAPCPPGSTCEDITVCCSTITCASPVATCNAFPACDSGDSQVMGTCPPDTSCYTRTLCGNTINCRDDHCDPAADYNDHYVGMGSCAAIDFSCTGPTQPFFNACGCGCRQDASCPPYVDCSPGFEPKPDCTEELLDKCPYTTRAL